MRRLEPGSDPGQAHRGRLPVRPERLLHVLAAAAAAAAAAADAKLYRATSSRAKSSRVESSRGYKHPRPKPNPPRAVSPPWTK